MKIVRTKMADALIRATHKSIDSGNNTGRMGARVLTNEAGGTGVIWAPRANKKKAAETADKKITGRGAGFVMLA